MGRGCGEGVWRGGVERGCGEGVWGGEEGEEGGSVGRGHRAGEV